MIFSRVASSSPEARLQRKILLGGFTVVNDAEAPPRGAVVAIGNFDGVHIGHRAVIDAAVAMAKLAGKPAFALTFDPHPRTVFQPDRPHFWLSDFNTKLRLLRDTGLDGAIVATFNVQRSQASAFAFIHDELLGRLSVGGVSVGYDYRFGKARLGTTRLLEEECRRFGISVHVEPRKAVLGKTVSSSAVRAELAQGKFERAAAMLGYTWYLTGSPHHMGSSLRYSNALVFDFELDRCCALREGAFAVRVISNQNIFPGVAHLHRDASQSSPLLSVHLSSEASLAGSATVHVAFLKELPVQGAASQIKMFEEPFHISKRLDDAWRKPPARSLDPQVK